MSANAVKFTDSGSVRVRTWSSHDGEDMELLFEIADTGIGIKTEQMDNLFDKFSQADRSTTRRHGGTGLGLAVSKELAELMGGQIWVKSEIGAGSRFWFNVRCRSSDGKDAIHFQGNDVGTKDAAPPLSGLHVLVAEDHRVNQMVIYELLTNMGHTVDLVENGFEAVAAVTRRPYDLVFMDIQMPELDGYEATRRIRALDSDIAKIPIIAVTANAMQGDSERCLDAGMNDHLAKPITKKVLMSALARWCRPDQQPENTPTDRSDTVKEKPVTDNSILDEGALRELEAMVGAAMHKIIQRNFDDYRQDLPEFEAAAERGDLETVRGEAHKYKSAFGYIGATAAANAAVEIEQAAAGGNGSAIAGLIEEFRTAADAAFAALELFLSADVAGAAPDQTETFSLAQGANLAARA